MRIKKLNLLWLFLPVIVFIKSGCVDVPKDLVMPKWDVDLTVPISSKSYTLWDAIKKDTSKLHYYTNADNNKLVYYSDIKRIDRITVGDNLKINSFSTSASAKISSINISQVNTSILPRDFSPTIPYNSSIVFPAVTSTTITKEFTQSAQSGFVTIESGALYIRMSNSFPNPIQFTISRLVIKNKTDNSTIVDDNNSSVIPAGQTIEKNYSLTGKTVYQAIIVEATISTAGSGSTYVTLNENNTLAFAAQVKNLVFTQVTARLDPNTFSMNDSYKFDDSTYVQSAVIDRGAINITANSNLDLDITATLVIPNLKNSSGGSFTQVINLGRKQKNKVIAIPSLSGYTLSDPSNNLINTIQYSITAVSAATSDYRTILKTDDINARIDISNLYFRSFTGRIKPTNLTVDETTIDLGLGDISGRLLMNQIDIENPSVQIKLRKSTNAQVNFSGQLLGRSSTHTAQMDIPLTTIGNNETIITLNAAELRNFIKSFSGKLPETISVRGKGVINPSYTTATIASADSLYGTAQIEFPMKVSITGGSLRDSSDVDISDNNRDEMKKVNGGTLNLEIRNGVAFDASVSLRLYDSANKFLMNLPANRAPNDTLIHVNPASVNSQGKVISSANSKITFTLTKADVDNIIKSKYLISKVSFYTTGNNGQPVEFKTSDAILIKAYGTLNYTVEEKK